VFFGGGTPSLIPPYQLEGILEMLHAQVGIDPDAEISMEADPGTFDLARLLEYMKLGVNRFSVGVQSFDEVGSTQRVLSGARFSRTHFSHLCVLLSNANFLFANDLSYLFR
jgi:hypothetical protein